MTPARRANKQKYRLDEGNSIQVWFEGKWHQVLAVAGTHWSNPDGGKNVRFEVATYDIGRHVVDLLNGHEHRAIVRLVKQRRDVLHRCLIAQRRESTIGEAAQEQALRGGMDALDNLLAALTKRQKGT